MDLLKDTLLFGFWRENGRKLKLTWKVITQKNLKYEIITKTIYLKINYNF